MNLSIARQAVRAWPRHELATKQQTRALQRGYIKARLRLGDRWLLAIPVPKKQSGSADACVLVGVVICGIVGMLL